MKQQNAEGYCSGQPASLPTPTIRYKHPSGLDTLRILVAIPNLGLGGAERMTLHLLRNLDRAKFTPALVSMYDEVAGPLAQQVGDLGVPVWFLGKRRGLDLKMYGALDRVVRHFRPHVVHTHRYMLQYMLPILIRHDVAAVHTVHSIAGKEVGRLGRLVHRAAFHLGVAPVSIAHEVQETMAATYGHAYSGALIPNGIPVDEFVGARFGRGAWRATHGWAEDEIVFVCVARLVQAKNHELLLRAFAPVAATGKARLLLVGNGPLRQQLQGVATALGIEEYVSFLGAREDVAAILGASDVFVLPSTYEGNPLSVMEAMAAGLPVIATAVGGVPELLDNGSSGLLVRSGDEQALRQAIDIVADDPERGAQMGAAGQEKAKRQFGARAMATSYGNLYVSMSRNAGPKTGRHEVFS
jgi:glycosyltransferase involved in cell wall biosynthesis